MKTSIYSRAFPMATDRRFCARRCSLPTTMPITWDNCCCCDGNLALGTSRRNLNENSGCRKPGAPHLDFEMWEGNSIYPTPSFHFSRVRADGGELIASGHNDKPLARVLSWSEHAQSVWSTLLAPKLHKFKHLLSHISSPILAQYIWGQLGTRPSPKEEGSRFRICE